MFKNLIIDAAAEEKNRLETKQRNAKKIRTKSKTDWTPRLVILSLFIITRKYIKKVFFEAYT